MDDELFWLPGWQLRQMMVQRQLSPVELARATLERIATLDPALHAFVSIDPDDVVNQARRAEVALMDGDELGPLHGVPVSIKDSIPSAGLPTTYGSRLYADSITRHDSVPVRRLRAAGAVVVGKTNVPEFQVVSRSYNLLMPETVNPWALDRTSGGSSGGAAVSVAAGMVPIALGGDDGGSIRLPAALCGLFGLCPSHGRVPRLAVPPEGGYPGFIFQNIGPLVRDVRDGALVTEIISGPDPSDPFAMRGSPVGCVSAMANGVDGCRALWVTFPGAADEREAVAVARDAARRLRDAGVTVDGLDDGAATPVEVSIEPGAVLNRAYQHAFLRRIAHDPAARAELSPWAGAYVDSFLDAPAPSSAEEAAAWQQRRELIARFDALFEHHDVLLCATLGDVAPTMPGWELALSTEANALATVAVNVTGLAAASVPAGFVGDLPIGLQIIGPRGSEAMLVSLAHTLEKLQPWAQHRPPVAATTS